MKKINRILAVLLSLVLAAGVLVTTALAAGTTMGDVDFDAVREVAGWITPVPGGVGAVTTAVLCRHVIEAAEKSL